MHDMGHHNNNNWNNVQSNWLNAIHTGPGNGGYPVQQGIEEGQFTELPQQSQQPAVDEVADVIKQLVAEADESLSQGWRNRLSDLLWRYSNLLSVDPFDVGCIPNMEHVIDTGNARPFRQRLRRHPPAHQKIIKEQVDQMYKQGLIRPSMSPYASNVVLVRKAGDSTGKAWRLCIDHRDLNKQTVVDSYQTARIDSSLDALAGMLWFSSLDIRLAFHNLQIRESDRHKTAFITDFGCWEMNRLSFGLRNAPSSWSRCIDFILSGITPEYCICYFDDLAVMARSPEEMLYRLEVVFERLSKYNLRLKPSKCKFFRTSIDYLGHHVSREGVSTQRSKVQAVTEWPECEDSKQVRRFLGLTGYYRKYIKGYAEIAKPLTDLLSPGVEFKWTEQCRQAMNTLKQALVSADILALPRDGYTYHLDVDASDHSIGCVLSQEQPLEQGNSGTPRTKVIGYASKKLTPAQRNYCVTRRELLGLVYYLAYYRHLLLGNKVVVRTDHAALVWLRNVKEPTGQLARWLQIIDEFEDLEIQYRAGTANGNADAMSRRPCDKPRCCKNIDKHIPDEEPYDVNRIGFSKAIAISPQGQQNFYKQNR